MRRLTFPDNSIQNGPGNAFPKLRGLVKESQISLQSQGDVRDMVCALQKVVTLHVYFRE